MVLFLRFELQARFCTPWSCCSIPDGSHILPGARCSPLPLLKACCGSQLLLLLHVLLSFFYVFSSCTWESWAHCLPGKQREVSCILRCWVPWRGGVTQPSTRVLELPGVGSSCECLVPTKPQKLPCHSHPGSPRVLVVGWGSIPEMLQKHLWRVDVRRQISCFYVHAVISNSACTNSFEII